MTQLPSDTPALFTGRHFDRLLIQQALRWYITYKLSYRDVCELMAERGVSVVHTTVMRWVQHYVPVFERRWKKYARPVSSSWRVDETYIRVKGRWTYLYRAVDKEGMTVDFLLSEHRDISAAKRFFTKALQNNEAPEKITLDGYEASHTAVALVEGRRSVTGECCGANQQVLKQPRGAGSPASEAAVLPDARLQAVRECGSDDQRD
jgi:transposase-like protein